jgi:hypothetical protein
MPNFGFYAGRYQSEQTKKKPRSFIRERFQNSIKGFVDAGVPQVHICLVGRPGEYSQERAP